MDAPTCLTHLFADVADASDQLARMGEGAFEPSDGRDEPIGAAEFVGKFRHAAADLIVWLEIKGRSDDAGEVDDAIDSVMEIARAYDRGELPAKLPDNELAEPITPIDQAGWHL